MNTTIIGVAGGTASGKSTLVKKLQEAFEGESVITLCHDYYYKAHDDLSFEERTKLNYDHPGAFDTDMMIEDIMKLKKDDLFSGPFILLSIITVRIRPSKSSRHR